MAGYQDIVGHLQIKEQLKSAVEADKVSHAYIFNGPKDSGKMMLAEAFAMALQCENNDPNGCGECKSCKQAMHHNQPDIIYIQHEKPNVISVGEIREQLVGDMEIKPYSSKHKIYIVDEAEKMNPQAQNALLKTIEEPPHYGIIMLLTSNAEMLLQTIRSRCVRVDLRTVSNETVKKYLMEKHQIPDYQANVAAAFAQGNVGRAINLSTSQSFADEKNSVLSLVQKVKDIKVSDMTEKIKEIETYKDDMDEYINLMEIWYRDVLYFKSTRQPKGVIFQDKLNEIQKQADMVEYAGIQKAFDALDTARIRLAANGSFELIMELMLLEIKEIYQWQR
ncbi:MAG: DNA polymerase III subunit delta' [Lachnospiraceae bacterium]|nr:DNA polymerase III subunit delta' [Lachnospiraceae bacterium]